MQEETIMQINRNVGEEIREIETLVCESCGLKFNKDSLKLLEKNSDNLGNNKDISSISSDKLNYHKPIAKLCPNCTLNYTQLPNIKTVISAIAYGIYATNLSFTNPKVAIFKAKQHIIKLPYWKMQNLNMVQLKALDQELISIFKKVSSIYKFTERINEVQNELQIESMGDIFISHSWNGPEQQLVFPLLKKLKNMGYSIWIDKEKGLKPGELKKFLKETIQSSKNCLIILCKEYFQSENTLFELDQILQYKAAKHIIPVWYSGIDTDFLSKQGELGEKLLELSSITWENCSKDIDALAAKIDQFIDASQDIKTYNGVKLYENDVDVLEKLEKIVGEKIPPISQEMIEKLKAQAEKSDQYASKMISYAPLNFGFVHKNQHIIALILKKVKDKKILPITLPSNVFKLKKLRHLCVPLINIDQQIGNLKELYELDLEGSIFPEIPLAITKLKSLEILNLKYNNIIHANKDTYEFLNKWLNWKQLTDLNPYDSFYLSLLLKELEFNEEFSGYSVESKRITEIFIKNSNINFLPRTIGIFTELKELDLYNNNLSSLPESIGNLKSLTELNLSSNNLSSLPNSIGNLKSLTELNLSSNNLSSLPNSIGNLTNLKELDLQFNRLSSFPNSIGNLTNLKELDLQFNKISSLPESIGALKNLTCLNLHDNNLSSLPESIGNLKNLTELNLEAKN
ncbi:MAG: leucine-rich repeat domain-containing protein [Promethearchaeota archaeon]